MPLLFALLLALAVRSLTLPGAMAGVAWFLTPDFSQINSAMVLAALGQAFFSLGVGMAAGFAFGGYMHPRNSDVPGNVAIVVACDTAVAVLAGFVIFPALFAFNIAPDAGPGLLFVTMPQRFEQMPGGLFFGGAFFLLLLNVVSEADRLRRTNLGEPHGRREVQVLKGDREYEQGEDDQCHPQSHPPGRRACGKPADDCTRDAQFHGLSKPPPGQ